MEIRHKTKGKSYTISEVISTPRNRLDIDDYNRSLNSINADGLCGILLDEVRVAVKGGFIEIKPDLGRMCAYFVDTVDGR